MMLKRTAACILAVLVILPILLAGCTEKKSAKTEKKDDEAIYVTRAVYIPDFPEGISEEEQKELLRKTEEQLEKRCSALDLRKAKITVDDRRKTITVKLTKQIDDQELFRLLCAPGEIRFVDADGKVWLSGSDIKRAEYENSPVDDTGLNRPHVKLELTEEGRQKLAEASSAVLKRSDVEEQYLAIYMDEDEISKPYVNKVLDTTEVVITVGSEDPESYARYLLNIFTQDPLPVPLKLAEYQYDD